MEISSSNLSQSDGEVKRDFRRSRDCDGVVPRGVTAHLLPVGVLLNQAGNSKQAGHHAWRASTPRIPSRGRVGQRNGNPPPDGIFPVPPHLYLRTIIIFICSVFPQVCPALVTWLLIGWPPLFSNANRRADSLTESQLVLGCRRSMFFPNREGDPCEAPQQGAHWLDSLLGCENHVTRRFNGEGYSGGLANENSSICGFFPATA